jgi:hypothetical protein
MKSKHFVVIAIVAILAALAAVGTHRAHVAKLSSHIQAQDAAGQDVTVNQQSLQAYVGQHMFTSANVYLKAGYDRAVAASQQAGQSQANGTVYAQAQTSCDQKGVDSIRQANCVQAYVAAHSSAQANPQSAPMPTPASFTKS